VPPRQDSALPLQDLLGFPWRDLSSSLPSGAAPIFEERHPRAEAPVHLREFETPDDCRRRIRCLKRWKHVCRSATRASRSRPR